MTSYPQGVDVFVNPKPTDLFNAPTVPHAQQHSDLNDAMTAVETELGVEPSGAFDTVALRLGNTDVGVDWSLTTPDAPSVGVTLFTRYRTRRLPAFVGPSGLDSSLQPALFANSIAIMRPNGNSTTLSYLSMNAGSVVGTATSRSVATTNYLTQLKRIEYKTAATINAVAEWRGKDLQWYFGASPGRGGFFAVMRFGFQDIAADTRGFVGFTNSTSALSGTVEPSTFTNCFGIGFNSTDSTLRFQHNDGSGAATTVDIPDLSKTVNTDAYELRMFAAPNSRTLRMSVEKLGAGGVYEYVTEAVDVPSANTLLAPHMFLSTPSATIISIDIVGLYIETDY